MPTNKYLSPNGYTGEQELYESLITESIQHYGQDLYYIPRDTVKVDDLLGEVHASNFNEAYLIEMYPENIDGFDGQDVFQKFGVEIRDEVTLIVSRRQFKNLVTDAGPHSTLRRPREGDLIFIPYSSSLFEIMFVEHEEPFYQLMNVPTFKLRCSLFEYNGENFDVEIEGLDELGEADYSQVIEAQAYTNKLTMASAGLYQMGETVTQTISGINTTGEIVKISEDRLTLWVAHIKNDDGDYKIFESGTAVVGGTSGVSIVASAVAQVHDEWAENTTIETEADNIIDFSESNPFGEV